VSLTDNLTFFKATTLDPLPLDHVARGSLDFFRLAEVHQVHIEAISKEKALNVLKRLEKLPDEPNGDNDPDDADVRPGSGAGKNSDHSGWRIAAKNDKEAAAR
jgi:hypothetical protein